MTALGVLLAAAAVVVLGPAVPAAAHASLLLTDPADGAVLASAPDRVTFTFDEEVVPVPEGVQVLDARGETVASSVSAAGTALEVGLEEQVGDGTLVVVWRVVSSDGHPVAGSLTFSVGEPSANVVPAPGGEAGPSSAPVWLSLARGAGYTLLLVASGLVAFTVVAATALPAGGAAGARRRLVVVSRVSALAGAGVWVAMLPLTAAYQLGTAPVPSVVARTWATLPSGEFAVATLVALGLVAAAALLGDGRPAGARGAVTVVAAAVAAGAPALTGHPRATSPEVPAVAADVLHLLAGGVWLGGLVGLALVLPALRGSGSAAEVLARFSGVAAGALAVLVVAGSVLAWRVVGSWGALTGTDYGRLLLLKVGVAVLAVGVAAWNRYVLVPRSRERARGPGAPRALARTVVAEAAALAAVVLVTGVLVDTSPTPPAAAASLPDVPAGGARAALGDVVVVADASPPTAGPVTLTIRLQHPSGGPAEGVESLTARLSSDAVDLGEVPLAFVEPGRFAADVVLPAPGTWRLQVSVRRSEFVNPVATLEFEVGGPAGGGGATQ